MSRKLVVDGRIPSLAHPEYTRGLLGIFRDIRQQLDEINIAITNLGGGGASNFLQGAFNIASGSDTIALATEGFTSTNIADFIVWSNAPSVSHWLPLLPSTNLQNDPTLVTFSISGSTMSFSGLTGFTEGGSILIRQIKAA